MKISLATSLAGLVATAVMTGCITFADSNTEPTPGPDDGGTADQVQPDVVEPTPDAVDVAPDPAPADLPTPDAPDTTPPPDGRDVGVDLPPGEVTLADADATEPEIEADADASAEAGADAVEEVVVEEVTADADVVVVEDGSADADADAGGPVVPWCVPCVEDVDCGDPSSACVQALDAAGSFCGAACDLALDDCPPDYVCVPVGGPDGGRCALPTAECKCTPEAELAGASTACVDGCAGLRTCEGQALGPCVTPEPSPEVCDGEDNNCDGGVDEGFPDLDGDGVADCPEPSFCGDDSCDFDENCASCALDCGSCDLLALDCKGVSQPAQLGGCGAIKEVGCCVGAYMVVWCEGADLYCINCFADVPLCGWYQGSGYYDCGTLPGADPTGTNPKPCAAL